MSVEEQLAELQREVRLLRDRQDILDCINAYGRGLDRLDADLVRGAYHPDAIDEHGPFVGGIDAFVPWAMAAEGSLKVTHHGVTSHSCEIDGDVAHAESYVYFIVAKGEDGAQLGTGFGRYIDKLERRGGKWAISVRRYVMDFGFEIARSGWMGPDWERPPGRRDHADISYERPLSVPAPR